MTSELGLVALAIGMAAATAVLLWGASRTRTVVRAGTILLLFAMMLSMLLGLAVYAAAPSAASATLGLWGAGLAMAVAAVAVFAGLLRYARPADDAASGPVPLERTGPFAAAVVAFALASEVGMGAVFSALAPGGAGALGAAAGNAASFLAFAVNSPWFLFSMAAEMALTTLLLGARLPLAGRVVLGSQAVIMLFSPPALGVADWSEIAVVASSAAMIALFVYLMEHLYRHRALTPGYSTYLVALLGIYALMMAGLFDWSYFGSGLLFAVAVLLEMVAFFEIVVRPTVLSEGDPVPWQLRPSWAFAVLSAIFVAELFMGAVLDVALEPSIYAGGFPLLPMSGTPATLVADGLTNGFWFMATVTASTWFLGMMGIEMGVLVLFKIRESRNLENRLRLGLMMACYGAFAVFYPSLYFGLLFPRSPAASQVPVLGWSMGIGSYPLAIGVFGVVLLTYVLTGAIVTLFGRRAICSVFCTAPLMYLGTTIDAMKSFNRSSPVARKYLSSRLSTAYRATTGVVMSALVGTAVLSYLDTIGRTNLYFLGTDPSVFLFTASFSVAWYVMFVTIPYTGNFNCVTMGWCYTGTIAQAFQKVSFFKLKVKDRNVCKACTTLDCAKGCPVGLVDMPGHFRTKGEFRSTKCCGIGDCVEDCPYGNLYIADVRHWIRRRLGRPEMPPDRPLPMVRSVAPRAGAPAPARPPVALEGVR